MGHHDRYPRAVQNSAFAATRVVPFVGELVPEPDIAGNDVICMGSYAMRHYAQKVAWNPGVFDLAPHDFEEQRQHWGDAMLNADSEVVRFAEVRFGGDRFVRPIEDTKAFTGAVFDWHSFAEWQERVVAHAEAIGSSLTGDTLVQVATPKPISQEVRCWVVEGRVLTASTYRLGREVIHSNAVDALFVDFAAEQAARWSPERAYCLDVCDTPEGPRIVEINTVNSAGFYAADVQKLVMALDGLRR